MAERDQREEALNLYHRGVPLELIVARLGGEYTLPRLRYELWDKLRRRIPRNENIAYQAHNPDEDAPFDPQDMWAMGVTMAYADLIKGMPCTFGAKCNHGFGMCSVCNAVEEDDHPYATRECGKYEVHACAPDAYAWFTSMEFVNGCEIAGWDWHRHVKSVMLLAEEHKRRYPFVALEEALVWRVAADLELSGKHSYERWQAIERMRYDGVGWKQILRRGEGVPCLDSMVLADRLMQIQVEVAA